MTAVEGFACVIALGYLLVGVTLAVVSWPDLDRGAHSTAHYWAAFALIVFLWPKALRDIHRDR